MALARLTVPSVGMQAWMEKQDVNKVRAWGVGKLSSYEDSAKLCVVMSMQCESTADSLIQEIVRAVTAIPLMVFSSLQSLAQTTA